MLGTLRLILALSVAAFHGGWRPEGLRIGVCAVVMFYMISGYAMSGLAAGLLRGDDWAGRAQFWRDRLLRLFPQYFLWMGIAAIVVIGMGRRWLFQQGALDGLALSANLLMAPLCLYMYVPAIGGMMLLPQAWSLGTELGFYALFPFLCGSRRLALLTALGGLGVLAAAMLGALDAEYFGYRLLPGTLPFFLMGRAMFTRDKALIALFAAGFAALIITVTACGRLDAGYNRELALAMLVGPAALTVAIKLPAWPGDAVCGHASYGAYLAHIALMVAVFGVPQTQPIWLRASGSAAMAALAGLLGWALVDRNITVLRRRLRRQAGR